MYYKEERVQRNKVYNRENSPSSVNHLSQELFLVSSEKPLRVTSEVPCWPLWCRYFVWPCRPSERKEKTNKKKKGTSHCKGWGCRRKGVFRKIRRECYGRRNLPVLKRWDGSYGCPRSLRRRWTNFFFFFRICETPNTWV